MTGGLGPPASRRTVLWGLGAATAALAAPAIIGGRVRASSGQINILMWSDYLPPPFVSAFEAETGVKINHTGIGSNEELMHTLVRSKGEGYDIAAPSFMRALQWKPRDLLQPINMSRVDVSGVNPSMVRQGEREWALDGKNLFWLPHIWGTEGIAWRTDLWAPLGPQPTFGDVWVGQDTNGLTMGRPHSMMLGAGLYMERSGLMAPGSMWRAYGSEDEMRPVWERVTEFCINNRHHVGQIWNDADAQQDALYTGEVICGQTWDGPPLAMKTGGLPVTYQAPMEGALAWVDGMVIPKGARNIDQIYAFIKFAYRKEHAGRAIDFHGYNSPVIGADGFASPTYARNFAEAYPGEALGQLNPWPAEPPWYANVRSEYRDAFVKALKAG